MKKKVLRFLKIFGISFGAVLGLVALVVGWVAISGGFKERYQALVSMTFSQNVYLLDEDFIEVLLVPDDSLVTELDVNVYIQQGSNIIALPDLTDEEITIGTPFKIYAQKHTITVGEEEIEVNVGGEAQIIAEQNLITTSCKIFVDVPVIEFNLTADNNEEIYPGDQFTVGVGSILPTNSLNPSTLSNLNISRANKVVVYSSSNTEIATISASGVVNVLKQGDFTIDAYIITTYYNALNEPNPDDFDLEDYIEAMDQIRVKSSKDFTSLDIQVENLTVSKTTKNYNLFSTINLDVTDVGLVLHPQTGSGYTSADLAYKLTDVIAYEGFFVTAQQAENDPNPISILNINGQYIKKSEQYLLIEKTNNSPLTWQLKILDYKVGTNCIVFELPEVRDEENNIISQQLLDYLPVTINKIAVTNLNFNLTNDATKINLNLQNISGSQLQEDTYNLNDCATVVPSNASLKTVLFFTEQGQNVISADEKNVVFGLKLVATGDDEIEYEQIEVPGLVYPIGIGQTTIWACVVKTDIDGNYVLDDNGDYIIEWSTETSKKYVVNVSQELIINSADIVDDEGLPLLTNTYNGNNSVISTTLVKDVEAYLILNVNSNEALLSAYGNGLNSRLSIVSSDENLLLINVDVQSNALIIELNGVNEGSTAFEIYLDDEVVYNIACTVISDRVTGLSLSANGNVSALITNNSFVWEASEGENFALNIAYTPTDASIKSVLLETFAVPNGYESNPNGTYTFVEDTSVLEITNSLDYNYENATYNFKKAGKVLIRALSMDSRSDEVYSNYYLLTVTIPDIDITFNYPQGYTEEFAGKTYEKVVAVNNTEISLIIQREETGVEGAKFTAKYNNGQTNIDADLFNFRFKNGGTTSLVSGAIIDNVNKKLILKSINETKYEEIEIYTDFGFVFTVTYNYSLIADYKATINYTSGTYEEVYGLNYIDLFGGESPRVVITNYAEDTTYYPVGYNGQTGANYKLLITTEYQYQDYIEFDESTGLIRFIVTNNPINSLKIYISDPTGTDPSGNEYFITYNFKVNAIAQYNSLYENPSLVGGTTYSNFNAPLDPLGTIDLSSYISISWIDGATVPIDAELNITEYSIYSVSAASINYTISPDGKIIYNGETQILSIANDGVITMLNTFTDPISLNLEITSTITLQDGFECTFSTHYFVNINAQS